MAAPSSITARVQEAMTNDRLLSTKDLCAMIYGNTGSVPNYDTVRKARKRFLDGQALTSLPASKANGQPIPRLQPLDPPPEFNDPPQVRGTVGQAIRDVLAAVDVLGADGVLAIVEFAGADCEKRG